MSMAHRTTHARFSELMLSWLLVRFRPNPRARLDPRTLSEHLKRDLGFLDGTDVPSRTCWSAEEAPYRRVRD